LIHRQTGTTTYELVSTLKVVGKPFGLMPQHECLTSI
jgi:hypothetical protein